MKKLAAILLFCIYLFNLLGYRMLFNYVQQQADRQLEVSFDNNDYNNADLLTITVPLSLPYQNDEADFKRVDGEITVDGVLYKYVKRKVTNGNLVLLCLPDHRKMRIQSAKDEFFKYANDLVQNNQSKKTGHSKSFKNALGEFDHSFQASLDVQFFQKEQKPYAFYNLHYSLALITSPAQPPELLA